MNIVVPIKLVPDLVEELEINEEGTDLDREFLTCRINEFDDQALEEALQLADSHGGQVCVLALDCEECDKVLYTALAKGAHKAVKITGLEEGASCHQVARVMARALGNLEFDLVLCGVQAADDRDGQLPVLLGAMLGIPHLSVVSDIKLEGQSLTLHKEYAGGRMARFEGAPPLVLGIQAAREAPRYAPVSRVRQIMREAEIEELAAGDAGEGAGSSVRRMRTPEKGAGAEMLEGSAEEVVARMVEILNEKRS